jgi:midasin (ATPase involved in ribosome maturation)
MNGNANVLYPKSFKHRFEISKVDVLISEDFCQLIDVMQPQKIDEFIIHLFSVRATNVNKFPE